MWNLSHWITGTLLCLLAPPAVYAQLYDAPFRAEDLDQGNLRIYWGKDQHPGGIQKYGYDLGAMRYDAQAKKWTEHTVSDAQYNQSPANDRWVVYGKPVYAMRDGKVIACWRNAPENPPGGLHAKVGEGFVYGGGNGYWIEHSDGTRAEYAHMIPGSVPSALCPHGAQLLPSKIASPDVTNAWPHIRVPAAQQVAVKKGQFLGRVGNSGTSTAPHLHVHVEQGGTAAAVKSGGTPVQISFRQGLSAPVQNADPTPSWTSFAGKPIPAGPVLVWPPRTLVGEYTRHGYPADQFQALFDHLADSGFWPVWIDVYNVGGKNYLNHVWRPATAPWRAHFLVSGQTHQSNTDAALAAGFGPVFVESSVSDGQPRYTAIFVQGKPADMIMRHGLTAQQQDQEMASAVQRKLYPVNVSVISLGGQRRYTVLYRPESTGSWEIRPQIPEAGYQAMYDANAAAGRRPIYLNAYMHDGQPFLSAIFASKSTGVRKDRHGISAQGYQGEWDSAFKAGMLTRAVTAFDGAQAQHRFAAAWWK